MRSVVVDGNFKADHVRQKRPEDDVWLTAGEGIYAERTQYMQHLALAKETKEARHYPHYPLAHLIDAVRRIPAIVPFEHWKQLTCRVPNKMTSMEWPAMPVPDTGAIAQAVWWTL